MKTMVESDMIDYRGSTIIIDSDVDTDKTKKATGVLISIYIWSIFKPNQTLKTSVSVSSLQRPK